jgi:methionine-rich copper-binding protein CopC
MKSSLIALVGISFLLAGLGASESVADPVLLEAFPPVDSVQASPPLEIRLRFDRPLNDEGSSLQITDGAGRNATIGASTISPSDQAVIFASLPALVEGSYTVHYQLAAQGSSTISVGSYAFTIDLPPPILSLTKPLSGESFPEGEAISLQLEARFFDFDLYNNRVRVYVDGSLQDEIRSLNYSLTNLSPGVHEVKLILAQSEDTEFPETANIVYIAVAQGASGAVSADNPSDAPSVSPLTLRQAIVTILVVTMLIASGIWLGRELDLFDSREKHPN